MLESAALVSGDMIGLVALNFVLGIIIRCVMDMVFVIKIAGMNLDDRARHPPRLGIPAHVIPDFEMLGHSTNTAHFSHITTGQQEHSIKRSGI